MVTSSKSDYVKCSSINKVLGTMQHLFAVIDRAALFQTVSNISSKSWFIIHLVEKKRSINDFSGRGLDLMHCVLACLRRRKAQVYYTLSGLCSSVLIITPLWRPFHHIREWAQTCQVILSFMRALFSAPWCKELQSNWTPLDFTWAARCQKPASQKTKQNEKKQRQFRQPFPGRGLRKTLARAPH